MADMNTDVHEIFSVQSKDALWNILIKVGVNKQPKNQNYQGQFQER